MRFQALIISAKPFIFCTNGKTLSNRSKNLFSCFSSSADAKDNKNNNNINNLSSDSPQFQAYLDFKFIKNNLSVVKENCEIRNAAADPEKVVKLYNEYTNIKLKCDVLRKNRNKNAQEMKV